MHGKNNHFFRYMHSTLSSTLNNAQSALLLGPRQVGKTWLIQKELEGREHVISIPLQLPSVRQDYERDPSLLLRQVRALPDSAIVFIDEAQKVPTLFDTAQYLIDERKASFIFSGSSARKLRRKGVNLLPGRVLSLRLDPLMWSETGQSVGGGIPQLRLETGTHSSTYSFDEGLVYGALPGIASEPRVEDRAQFLRSYAQIYIEEEIRAEALARNIGSFSRFLELAASESGGTPNYNKLSMESGVSAPTIKAYFSVLEDTLVIERVEPYLKNARKRILQTPRYFFFDLGVRNALARLPLTPDLVQAQKGVLFEHAVVLELIRRCRALRKDYRVCFWRTSNGLEVDCVVDCGTMVIPIEIKSARRVALSELRGLRAFLEDYPDVAPHGYVVTMGDLPEALAENITALPWRMI